MRADTRAGAHGGYPSSGDGIVGGLQELATYDNAAYDGRTAAKHALVVCSVTDRVLDAHRYTE